MAPVSWPDRAWRITFAIPPYGPQSTKARGAGGRPAGRYRGLFFMRKLCGRLDLGVGCGEACGAGIPAIRESKMKHLIYAVVAAAAVGFSAGAYANCGADHTAAADQSIVVAQQQVPGTPATQGSEQQGSGATAGQSK
jgi:hypothetical protein